MKRFHSLACGLVTAALAVPVAQASAAALPAQSPARTVECDDAATGVGAAPPAAARVGPFNMPGKGELGSHWDSAAGRFASKVPIVIEGARPVTVRVPERLEGRLALTYGGGRRALSGEITFVPCANRQATFFPGGMLSTRREPLSLLVQPEGWIGPKLLRLGVIPPYRSRSG